MASVGDALSVLNVFWTTYKDFKANREECRSLHKYAHLVLERMEKERGGDAPEALQKRLANFIAYV